MADEKKPDDIVTTYTVGIDGVMHDTDKELKDALAKGYRVVDAIPCQFGNALSVTVVLTCRSTSATIVYKYFEKG